MGPWPLCLLLSQEMSSSRVSNMFLSLWPHELAQFYVSQEEHAVCDYPGEQGKAGGPCRSQGCQELLRINLDRNPKRSPFSTHDPRHRGRALLFCLSSEVLSSLCHLPSLCHRASGPVFPSFVTSAPFQSHPLHLQGCSH